MDSADNKARVAILRQRFADKLSAQYNTDYNILRWLIGHDHDVEKAALHLNRHLQMRHVMDLDNICKRSFDNEVIKEYVPMGFLGSTGLGDNRSVIIECIGRSDTHGLMKAAVVGEFAQARLQVYERALQAMQKDEATNGELASVIYIYDMDKLELDPFLLSVVLGPVRLMWDYVTAHYPELIYKVIVINGPPFLSLLQKALKPFLPSRTAAKTVVLGHNWKEELQTYVHRDYLPVHWGGTMVDTNGDEMMRSRIVVPPGKVPKHLYWSAKQGEPDVGDLTKLVVPAGGRVLLSTRVTVDNVQLHWYFHSNQWAYTLAIYVDGEDVPLPKHEITPSEATGMPMREYFPPVENPAMVAVDHYVIPLKKAGVYHVKFGNEHSWLRQLTIGNSMRFTKENGDALPDGAIVPLNYELS